MFSFTLVVWEMLTEHAADSCETSVAGSGQTQEGSITDRRRIAVYCISSQPGGI
jgi:hypothetical protein